MSKKRLQSATGAPLRKHGAHTALKNRPRGPGPKQAMPSKTSGPKQHTAPTIPFVSTDRIFLVGEADLSYAASLVRHHGCTHITASVLEGSLEELVDKYPTAEENVRVIQSLGEESNVNDNGGDHDDDPDAQDLEAEALASIDPETYDGEDLPTRSISRRRQGQVLFGLDATKMSPTYDIEAKRLGKGRLGAFDSIQFMFPHVGGKSTDVARQVRYNQELLLGFFKRAVPSLAPRGRVCVTLFEGEPYEQWNIRALARGAGLGAEKSFKFQGTAYPGYAHARTLGVVRNKKTGEVSESGWKGEERPARTYVFVRKGDLPEVPQKGRKRKQGDADLEDDD